MQAHFIKHDIAIKIIKTLFLNITFFCINLILLVVSWMCQ